MSQPYQLGNLQLAIMRILWERGEASAREIHGALYEERGLAPTTIATMLRKMEHKGVVEHRAQGRQFIYRAGIAESDVREGMVGDLVERLFCGDSAALIHYLFEAGKLDTGELEELRARLRNGGSLR